MSKHGKIYAKKLLADDTLNVTKSQGWEEFEPQFKDMIQDKPTGKSKESLELGSAQRNIVDSINYAADHISDGKIDQALITLRAIKGMVYGFLTAVKSSDIPPEKTEEVKELIYNMIQGTDTITDDLMPKLEEYKKTGEGDIEDIWQRLMKLTVLFIGIQATNIVATINPTQTPR